MPALLRRCALAANVLPSGSATRSLSCASNHLSSRSHCHLLIVGAGSGGLGAAAMLGGKYETTIVDSATYHYYQPYFTLVGAGLKKLTDCRRPLKKLIPPHVRWIQDKVATFDPLTNTATLADSGASLRYDLLVVATGIVPDFTRITGLTEALRTPYVGSNYTPDTVTKTLEALQRFQQGNALFTMPATPIKCPGAPQKIAYLADEFLRRRGRRGEARIVYATAGGALFGAKKYADALWKVVAEKQIDVLLLHNLVEVLPDRRQAVFEKLPTSSTAAGVSPAVPERVTLDYELLHVTPPMYPVDAVAKSALADANGFVDVNSDTLQHRRFDNVFAIGDCTSALPKTAAAVAASLGTLVDNVDSRAAGKSLQATYNGYTSCPLTTGFNKCILAEFNGFTTEPMETFPFNQAKQRRSMYFMKKDVIPEIYWRLFVKGMWTGPSTLRRLMRFGASS